MKGIIFGTIAAAISLISVGVAQADSLTSGIVNADGSKGTNGPYSVSHPTTGRYVITLTNYTGAAICMFNVIGGPTYIRSVIVGCSGRNPGRALQVRMARRRIAQGRVG